MEFGGDYVGILRRSGASVAVCAGWIRGPAFSTWKTGVYLWPILRPGVDSRTDKAQFHLRKNRNSSGQVAIDPAGKIDYTLGLPVEKFLIGYSIDAMQRL